MNSNDALTSGSRVTMAELHERSYRNYASRTAVKTGAGDLTYAELGNRVHRIVSGLRSRGIASGDRAVILLENRPYFFEIDQSLFVGGYVRVALSTRLHPMEIRFILEDCSASVIFTSTGILDSLRDELSKLPHVRLVVTVDDGPDSLSSLLAAGTPELPTTLPRLEDPAALLYTSGTTGAPKGATLSHGNWLAMVRNSMVELAPVTSKDVVLHVAPLSHLSGYAAPAFFIRGAAHIAMDRFDAKAVLDAIDQHGVTVVPMVPTMLNLLTLEAEARGWNDFPSLQSVIYAGSSIAPDRLARATRVFGDVFTQFYGLSELPMPLTCLSVEDHTFDQTQEPPARLASAGRPSPFVEARIVSSDGGPVPVGEVGEIWIRGDSTMMGYWNRPEATAEMLRPDGWAKTGDLGRFDQDGYLYVVDRLKDMIVTGGYNVYPAEVENAIATLPAVQEVAVVGVPNSTWGEAITAFVVVRERFTLTEAEVLGACRTQLAGYKKPRSIHFVPELPKTASGKLKKRELRS